MGGWGGFLDKLLGKIPIQNRRERWKNEIDNLKKERANLLNSKWDEKKSLRVDWINHRVEYLEQLIKNSLDS